MTQIVGVALALAAWNSAEAKPVSFPGLDLELVSEVDSIKPGQPFTVGLHLVHKPGYHTYWKNPGIVGVPTSLEWKLPKGFKAAPIRWPAPINTKMADINAWGYEAPTLLLVEITPPDTLAAGTIDLEAKGAWMCCAQTCNPGFTTFKIDLPVAQPGEEPKRVKRWEKKFAAARTRVPVAAKDWRFSAARKDLVTVLTITPPANQQPDSNASLGEVHFFSDDQMVHSDQPQILENLNNGSLRLTLKGSEFSPEPPSVLSGVLVVPRGWKSKGQRQAIRLSAKLPSVESLLNQDLPVDQKASSR